jgi:hypothetical protein
MEKIITWSSFIANISFVVAAVIAFFEYKKNRKQERIQKEKERTQKENLTFNELDDKFIQYQLLCLDNIDLDVHDFPDTELKVLDPIQKKRELILFTILFSIFERALLTYKGHADELRIKQWNGWDNYINSFAARKNFVEAWNHGKDVNKTTADNTYDTEFEKYLNAKIKKHKQ